MVSVQVDWLTLEGTRFDEVSFSRVWLVALATYGVGDVVTTVAIVYFSDFHTEGNPVVRHVIGAFGGSGFLGLKLLVIYGCLGVSLWAGVGDDDRMLFYAPPLFLALVGAFTTVHNLGLLLG
jgi:hypothetical protein